MLIFVCWSFVALVVLYLACFFVLVNALRNESNYWGSIGNPSIHDPNGQAVVLKQLFIPGAMSADMFSKYRTQVLAVRLLGWASIISFMVVFIVIYNKQS